MKKLSWLECIRGGVIVLVVLGHLTPIDGSSLLRKYISLFHMPLFFCISGFLYGYKEIIGLKSVVFVRKKMIALGIPYIVFSLAYIVLNSLFKSVVSTNTVVDLKDALFILVKPVAQYWFIWTLIIYFCISAVFIQTEKKIIITAIISIVVSIVFRGITYNDELVAYTKTIIWMSYFLIGSVIGVHYRKKAITPKTAKCLLLLLPLSIICYFSLGTYYINNTTKGLAHSTIQFVIGLFGIIGFSLIVILISKIRMFNNLLVYIAKYSWYTYLLHSYFTASTKVVITKLNLQNYVLVNTVFRLVVTFLCCIAVGNICKRWKYTDFLFYPYKYLMKNNTNL